MTDTELTEACSRGDSKAWRVLMARFKGLVRSMVVKMAASEAHQWDDIEQDCWLAVHQRVGGYDASRGTLENYMWGVVSSAITNGASDRNKEHNEVPIGMPLMGPGGPATELDTVTYPDEMSPEDASVRRECVAIATDTVLRAMPKMHPKAREAVGLYLLHGLRGGQIASKMGISAASVEDLLAEGQRSIDDSKVAASL